MFNKLSADPSLPVVNPTQSYWQLPAHERLLRAKPGTLPQQQDIVIIGSGVTACSVASELLSSNSDCSIIVLEAREVCSGATGRNGGRINAVAVLDFDKYRKKFGDEIAKSIIRFELAHYDEILNAAKALSPETFKQTEVRTAMTVAALFNEQTVQEFKVMLANFNTVFPDLTGRWKVVDEEEAVKDFHIQHAKGALIGHAGCAWPYRLITNIFVDLLNKHGNRFTIEANTPVLSISRNGPSSTPYVVRTNRGTILATHVIHCTEGHAAHLLPGLRGILVPRRGQMTVQNPGKMFPNYKGTRSWSFYFPNTFDYLSENVHTGEIFIGGGDFDGREGGLEVLGVPNDAEESITAKVHLEGVLPVVFGKENWGEQHLDKPLVKASWSGIMCNPLDSVPIVGMIPKKALGARHAGNAREGAEWISAGYGGYGMVNAWRCGKAVAQQVLGQPVPEWLPAPYRISSERMVKLSAKLSEVAGSEKHLKALL